MERQSPIGGISYILDYGAVLGVPDIGKYVLVDQRPGATAVTALDPTSERTILEDGTLVCLSWNTESADETTEMAIVVNEVVIVTLILTGGTTGVVDCSVPVLRGDEVAIEYDAGTAPGKSNWMLLQR